MERTPATGGGAQWPDFVGDEPVGAFRRRESGCSSTIKSGLGGSKPGVVHFGGEARRRLEELRVPKRTNSGHGSGRTPASGEAPVGGIATGAVGFRVVRSMENRMKSRLEISTDNHYG
jgi:hypothetical protein